MRHIGRVNSTNPNSALDPQNPMSAYAHMTPEEHAELQDWIDARAHEADAQAAPMDEPAPMDDQPPGWPGDGSGEDDLADLMAHGDEGCCDDGFEPDDGPAPCDDAHEAEDAYLDASYEDRTDSDFFGGE